MKKSLLVLLPLFAALPLMSQATLPGTLSDLVAVKKLRIDVTGGVNIAKITEKYSDLSIVTSAVTGFRGGFVVDYPLGEGLYLQPRVLVSGKGGKLTILNVEGALRPYYLEVPLNIVYKLQAGPGSVFGGLGPHAAMGIFGKVKTKNNSATVTRNLNFGTSKTDDLRPFDFGGNFLVGYELPQGWLLTLNYSLGLYNIVPPAKGDDQTAKNHYFGISVGYLLSGLLPRAHHVSFEP
jgi:hypothetical protein